MLLVLLALLYRYGQVGVSFASQDFLSYCSIGQPSVRNPTTMAPIHDVCVEANMEELEAMVMQDPEVLHLRDDGPQGLTPIQTAMVEGHVPVVEYLLNMGVDYNENDMGDQAFTWACMFGNVNVVRLLKERFPITLHFHHLMAAHCWAEPDMIKHLVTYQQIRDIVDHRNEADGTTALWWFAQKGWGEHARWLLHAGADPSIPNNEGRTPLQAIDRNGYGAPECLAALDVIL